MDPKRQQIITKIVERMQTITVANGYETGAGANVGDWETNWDDEQLPAISVCDLIEEIELVGNQPTAERQTNRLPVQLRLFAKSAAELRKGIADVFKAIKTDTRWSGLAMQTMPKRAGMVLAEDSFELGGAAVEIEIGYMTDAFDSYQ